MKTKLYVISWISFLLLGCQGSDNVFTLNNDTLTGNQNAILGGSEVGSYDSIGKHVVLLYEDSTHKFCSGTLISKNVVLTAAHCLSPGDNTHLTIIFGVDFLSDDYETRQSYQYVVHRLYNPTANENRNDIALISFKGTLPDGYEPASLPRTVSIAAGKSFTAVGYGRTSGRRDIISSDRQGSGRLRKVNLLIAKMSSNRLQFRIDQTSGRGICNGDSGGPAFVKLKGNYYVVGVASALSWTASPNDLCKDQSIYMNVKNYLPWIDVNMKALAL